MIDVVMPQMGESIVEGTLTKWLKKPGERVERDEPLFEISTDKVDTEIPAPAAGVLAEVLVEEGADRRHQHGGRAHRRERNRRRPPRRRRRQAAAPPPAPPEPEAPPPAPEPEPVAAAEEPAGPLSPLVRRMAREHNIDLRQVKGTGAGGRITKQDLEAYLAQRQAAPAPPPPPPPKPEAGKVRVEPMSVMRSKIAEHMLMSQAHLARTSPPSTRWI